MCIVVIGSGIILALGEFYNWDELFTSLICMFWPMFLLASPLIAIGFISYKVAISMLKKYRK